MASSFVATSVALPASGQVQTSGYLDNPLVFPNGAIIDNDAMRIVVRWDDTPGLTVDERVEVDIVSLPGGHAYEHRLSRLWEFRTVDTTNLCGNPSKNCTEKLGPEDCDPKVWAERNIFATYEQINLLWTDCQLPVYGDESIPSVVLSIVLPSGTADSEWTLTAAPTVVGGTSPPVPVRSYWMGTIRLSIVDPSGSDHLLSSQGFLTEDPAQNLAAVDDSEASGWFTMFWGTETQVSAIYDEGAYGLYLASADPTGCEPQQFAYSASADRQRINYQATTFAPDSINPASPFVSVPLRVARFRGDWITAAIKQREWLAAEASDPGEIASKGAVADRSDVGEVFKRLQMAFPIGAGAIYLAPPLPPFGMSIPERLELFRDHWNLDDIGILGFNSDWFEGGTCGWGEYSPSTEQTPFSTPPGANKWENNVALMDAAGFPFSVYTIDDRYATGQDPAACAAFDTYFTESLLGGKTWSDYTVVRANGVPLLLDPEDPMEPDHAFIDPSALPWQERLAEVAGHWAGVGVDGMYRDNNFPVMSFDPSTSIYAQEYCFSDQHGHLPGFGGYLARGMRDSMQAVMDAALAENPDGFYISNERYWEGGIPASAVYLKPIYVGDRADLMTGAAETGHGETRRVHLSSFVHGRYVLHAAVGASRYANNGEGVAELLYPGSQPSDQAIRTAGRRGALFTAAWAFSGGAPIDPIDVNKLTPNQPFSFECKPNPNPPTYDCLQDPELDDYRAACEFDANLARMRSLAYPFLSLGERVRDLKVVSPSSIPEVLVHSIPNGFWSSLGKPRPVWELESVPTLLMSTWRDVRQAGTDGIGFGLVNHSGQELAGLVLEFDPAKYGLSSSEEYDLVRMTAPLDADPSETVLQSGLTGKQSFTFHLLPESVHFYRIEETN